MIGKGEGYQSSVEGVLGGLRLSAGAVVTYELNWVVTYLSPVVARTEEIEGFTFPGCRAVGVSW